ncbi:MAG: hypothetical protein ACRC3Z_00405 [Phocaeicola sp.]
MKIEKMKISLFASFVATALTLSSCLNDGDATNYFTELGTVRVVASDANLAVVEGDVYGKSTITNSNVLSHYEANSEGQRIMYTFSEDQTSQSVTTDQVIRIYELYRVLTKPMDVLNAGEEDVYGDDKVNIVSYYLSDEHLNIQFQLLAQDRTIKHRISLVDTEGAYVDEQGYLHLEFRHNAENDRPVQLNWGFVSYTLNSIPGYEEGVLKGFKISYQSIYDGEKSITLEIKNSQEPTTLRMGTMPTLTAQ